jgi:ribonuclease HI
LLIGDGSGSTWDKEIGWGSTLIQKGEVNRLPFFGGMNHGTNNIAEVMMVLHPLMYIANSSKRFQSSGYHLHVISDSMYVVNGLRETDVTWSGNLKKNREVWMAIHMVRRRGVRITGHHVKRDILDLNKLGHDLANLARRSQIKLTEKLTWDPYTCNPDETFMDDVYDE